MLELFHFHRAGHLAELSLLPIPASTTFLNCLFRVRRIALHIALIGREICLRSSSASNAPQQKAAGRYITSGVGSRRWCASDFGFQPLLIGKQVWSSSPRRL